MTRRLLQAVAIWALLAAFAAGTVWLVATTTPAPGGW